MPSSSRMSCSPGTVCTVKPVAVISWCAVSNCAGFERWVMSPVWIMKAGFRGSAFTWFSASASVSVVCGFAGLSKPRWLSLICAKVNALSAASASPIMRERGTPPTTVHTIAVPAQVMQRSAVRRVVIVGSSVIRVPPPDCRGRREDRRSRESYSKRIYFAATGIGRGGDAVEPGTNGANASKGLPCTRTSDDASSCSPCRIWMPRTTWRGG